MRDNEFSTHSFNFYCIKTHILEKKSSQIFQNKTDKVQCFDCKNLEWDLKIFNFFSQIRMDYNYVTQLLQKAISCYKEQNYVHAIRATSEAKSWTGMLAFPPGNPMVVHIDVVYLLSSVELVNESNVVLDIFVAHLQTLGNSFIQIIMSYDKVMCFQFLMF